jgi:succinyl-CoA synthetase beta subunit
VFPSSTAPPRALRAVKHALAYRDFQRHVDAADESPVSASTRQRWCERLAAGDLGESDALDLLDAYGIATPVRRVAATRADVLRAADAIGYPVVLKTAVAGIAHKSDVGGVLLDLRDAAAVGVAYDDLALRLGPQVLVQAMVGKGVEAALGAVNDPDFGPYAMVAAGGILIELIEDRAVSLAPMSRVKASALIDRLRLRRVLAGLRGAPPADAAALADALWRLSHLAFDLHAHIAEVDVNPVLVRPDGAIAVDALVVRRAAISAPQGAPKGER